MFLKARSKLEEEHGKSMVRLANCTTKTEGKQGMYHNAWQDCGKLHAKIGEIKVNFALSINEIAENILILQRNTERSRKQVFFI